MSVLKNEVPAKQQKDMFFIKQVSQSKTTGSFTQNENRPKKKYTFTIFAWNPSAMY